MQECERAGTARMLRRWVGGVAVSVIVSACGGPTGQPFTTTPTSTATSPAPASPATDGPAPRATSSVPPAEPVPPSAPSTTVLPAGWTRAHVSDVIDGDTIVVALDGGVEERVRLIGINSPETGECFASEATEGLESLVGGRTVRLEPDVNDRDRFGRLLRYVWTTDGRLANEIVVEEGWALAREYPPDTARAEQLDAAEQSAADSGAGLWAVDACGETVIADIRIVRIEYDAEGDDNTNQNGEWVEIVNADSAPVDLTDWVLKDESASHRYSFPDGFTLRPGASARIHTGCGDDTATILYWCVSGSAVWNNDGDTAFLLDPGGNIVYSYAYG